MSSLTAVPLLFRDPSRQTASGLTAFVAKGFAQDDSGRSEMLNGRGVVVDGNDTRREQGEAGTTAASGSCANSTGGCKALKRLEPGPAALTRNLDSGPSLPIPAAGSQRKAERRWWWLVGIAGAVGLAIAIAIEIWLGIWAR
jgi:hypothetical protein